MLRLWTPKSSWVSTESSMTDSMVDVKLAAGIAATFLAIVLFLIGAAAVKWYAWDIAISQAGQPDRSMLFWGLPILFIGLIATIVSVGLALLARRAFTSR